MTSVDLRKAHYHSNALNHNKAVNDVPLKENNDIPVLKLLGHVGFDSLPDQLVNKTVSQGFLFNILCIGETGIGKSTLMDSLFNTNFDSVPSSHNIDKVTLKSNTYELQEGNVKMKLTLIETVGYGDQVNKENSFKAIVDYVDAQFEAYLQEELKLKRMLSTYHDSRIHACLYFLCPTGHGLKAIDLVCMKHLENRVNIIPIIAKADTIARDELQKFKKKIISELQSNGIHIYQFPTDDETMGEFNQAMNAMVPFAVVGSTDVMKIGNKQMRARQYPWGVVQVENEAHCDFVKLREALIFINMEDLCQQTHTKHYELYRRRRLQEMGFSDANGSSVANTFQERCEQRRNAIQNEMQQREEEMRNMFIVKVKNKEDELKEAEKELHNRFETLKKEHAEEKKRIEEGKKKLEDSIAEFQRYKLQALAPGSGHHTLSLSTLGKQRKK